MKKDNDEYISTKEPGKMLEISLSTSVRYFDNEILKGKKHPITNRRYISRERVLSLMKKYGMKTEDWD